MEGKWNVKGQAEGLQTGTIGTSYALPTVTAPGAKRSLNMNQITTNIEKLYDAAKQNADKEFIIAYTDNGKALNGYTAQEMADMFSHLPIPSNVVFEKNFSKLLTT